MTTAAVNHEQRVLDAYRGSSGQVTQALFKELEAYGADGALAIDLYRAQKASERAKVYRGGERGRGSYKGMAYDKKQWAMDNLCRHLRENGRYTWGWGVDDKQEYHRHVLYIDLPTGQVSFHNAHRGEGPEYEKPWDGMPGQSPDRICKFIAGVLSAEVVAP